MERGSEQGMSGKDSDKSGSFVEISQAIIDDHSNFKYGTSRLAAE
jgi:hypothetical protein